MFVQGELEFQENRKEVMTNPLFIAEVLSAATHSYDKDEKFSAYSTIPSFQAYLLIDQYSMHVEQYFKTDQKHWVFSEYDEANPKVSLQSIPFEIEFSDLYDKVEFTSVTAQQESRRYDRHAVRSGKCTLKKFRILFYG
jgi:Uma2 family endonuclease